MQPLSATVFTAETSSVYRQINGNANRCNLMVYHRHIFPFSVPEQVFLADDNNLPLISFDILHEEKSVTHQMSDILSTNYISL